MNTNDAMARVWIVCAFVDISGFGTWIYRANTPIEVKQPFIRDYLEIFQRYLKSERDVHFKYLGDGFLAIKEIPSANRAEHIAEFLKGLRCVARKLRVLINSNPQSPTGVRVRVTEGYAYKIMVVDPNDAERQVLIPEYIEYGINTAERLMEVNPETVCVVTEGVAKNLGAYRSFFRCRKLGPPSCHPKSVNKEDLETLHILTF